MKINVYSIMKPSNDEFETLAKEFIKMSSKYAKVEMHYIFNKKIAKAQTVNEIEAQKSYSETYEAFIKPTSYNIALDVLGKKADSFKFAKYFDNSAEVKKSEKPWIFFEKERKGSIVSEFETNYINIKGVDLLNFAGKQDSLYYKERIGSGIHEAFKSPNHTSRWYGACLSAIKSMHSELKNENNMFNSNHITHYTPLIILDGVLISAKMDNDSEICLEYIDRGFIDFEYESSNYTHKSYRVGIVTLNGLDDYLKRLKSIQYLLDSSLIELESFQNAVVNI